MVLARNIAEYTALGAATMAMAPSTDTVPSTQNVTASPVTWPPRAAQGRPRRAAQGPKP